MHVKYFNYFCRYMDENIKKYLSVNKVFTIATSISGTPYCANCFYAFDEGSNSIVFLSDKSTRHIMEATENITIAGTIQNGVTIISEIKGIQFTGEFIIPDKDVESNFYEIYYKKFPFAKERPSSIWGIKLSWIKMTDNSIGFGTKLIWER